jgi:hypothetical protein
LSNATEASDLLVVAHGVLVNRNSWRTAGDSD